MELKPKQIAARAELYIAFNRTSMELKPMRLDISKSAFAFLLIEPVWN